MKKLGILAAVLVGLYALYKLIYPTYSYRYRMTVEVDVRGETKSGASVIEVRLSKQPKFLPEVPAVATTVLGDAVFVDLGEGRNVIAVLASGPNGSYVDYPQHVVPGHFKLSYADRDLVQFPQLQGRWDLASQLPTLVTFTDLNDPKTAQVIYDTHIVETRDERSVIRREPRVAVDRFAEAFGPGVRLRRIWIEMTSEPITRGIEQKLPWLNHLERHRTDPSNPFSNKVPFGRPHLSRS